jgi:hypothetical protein
VNVTTFGEFRNDLNPADPAHVVMSAGPHRPNTLFLRVLNAPVQDVNRVSRGLRVYDRMHFFTGRLGRFPLLGGPVLGNGAKLL